jgi:hypothetical protein
MDRTNYVARAKRLLAQSARTAALVIVPLAGAAHAYAVPTHTLPTGNFACSQQGTGSNNCLDDSDDSQLPTVNQLAGVSFFNANGQDWNIAVSSGSSATLTLSANGTLGTALPTGTVIPVSYDFTLATTGVSIVSWSLAYDLGTSVGSSTFGSYTANGGAGGGTFSNSTGSITTSGTVSASTTLFETVILTVVPNENTGAIIITAPFDIGSQGSVPEPATVGTLGAGFGFLAWLYRRRKQS